MFHFMKMVSSGNLSIEKIATFNCQTLIIAKSGLNKRCLPFPVTRCDILENLGDECGENPA